MKYTFFVFFIATIFVSCQSFAQEDSDMENRLKSEYRAEKNAQKKYLVLLQLANYYQQVNIRKADSMTPKLIEASANLSDSMRLSAFLYKANMAERCGNRTLYFSTVKQCQYFLDKINDPFSKLDIYQHIGWAAHLQNDTTQALRYLNLHLQQAQELKTERYIIVGHLLLSQYYTTHQNMEQSKTHIQQAITLSEKMRNTAMLATCYHFQAKIYQEFELMDVSVEKGILALKTSILTKNNALIITILAESGFVEMRFHNYSEAESFFQQAIDKALSIHDDIGRAWARLGMAQIHLARGQLLEATFNCKRALNVYKQYNATQGMADAYKVLGQIYHQKEGFQRAEQRYNTAMTLYQQTHDLKKQVEIYRLLGQTAYQQKQYASALSYFERGKKKAWQHNFRSSYYQLCRSMATIYEQLHKYETAFKLQQQYLAFTDSSQLAKMMNRAVELNEKYKAQQHTQQILKQSDSIQQERKEKQLVMAQLENSNLRNNFQKYVIIGFGIVSILVVLVLYERFHYLKQSHRQKEIEMHLTVLRTQMNPHFIFNTISVIQSFLYDKNVEKTSSILVKFARLIRLTLENSTKREILIDVEEQILTYYLQTQQERFDHKFNFDIFIAKELKEDRVMLPPMITQPFVENAIEHGLLHAIAEGGMVQIRFEKTVIYHILNHPHAPTTLLEVIIEDNGIGLTESLSHKNQDQHRSMAVDITRERIKHLNLKYKTSGYVKIEDRSENAQRGTKVTLMLPYITENKLTNI